MCVQNIHDTFQENVPEDINPICLAMPEIKIDLNGVLKLLSTLKPDKAAGPDSIKPVVLKQLKMEIAPVICLLFEKNSSNWTTPFRMETSSPKGNDRSPESNVPMSNLILKKWI